MDLKQISQRAIAIRAKYSQFEKKKWGKEWTREQIAQGFVVDAADLMRLIMAKEGIREIEDADEKLVGELADCLWSILVLADKYGVDLEKRFLGTMTKIEKDLDQQLKS
jgi:NTP pyrophosphatase (non-canonical NTP hydrolase)